MPDPAQGSNTVSPSFVLSSNNSSNNFKFFCVGCIFRLPFGYLKTVFLQWALNTFAPAFLNHTANSTPDKYMYCPFIGLGLVFSHTIGRTVPFLFAKNL